MHMVQQERSWGKGLLGDSRKSICPAYGEKYSSCNKLGPFSKFCRLSTKTQNDVIGSPDPAIADIGVLTNVAGSKLLTALGSTEQVLLRVEQKHCGANNSNLRILGALFLQIKLFKDVNSNAATAETLYYVQTI